MAGKKDKVVVAVVAGLTEEQAAQISKEFMKAKQKNAPYGRGTIAVGSAENVGKMIQQGNSGRKKIAQRGRKNGKRCKTCTSTKTGKREGLLHMSGMRIERKT